MTNDSMIEQLVSSADHLTKCYRLAVDTDHHDVAARIQIARWHLVEALACVAGKDAVVVGGAARWLP